jgi:ribonuclease-3
MARQRFKNWLQRSAREFLNTAVVAGEVIAEGSGKSKREAEQSAARAAFEILQNRSE